MQWQFGPYRLDPDNACLWHGEKRLTLRPKTFELLSYLVEHADQLVSKETLMDAIWPGTVVVEGVLTTGIGELRKLFGETAKEPQFIATEHRRGYRFIAPVTALEPSAPALSEGTEETRSAPSKTPFIGRQQALKELRRLLVDEPTIPFVGRDSEYQRLLSLALAVQGGQGHLVLIEGEPGAGKTRLLQEVMEGVQPQGPPSLSAKCYQADQALPYQAVTELVEQALTRWPSRTFQALPLLSLAEIALLVPELSLIFPQLSSPPEGFDETRQIRLFRALTQFLAAPASSSGLLLVVDDIQWADPVTRQFLHHLAQAVMNYPLLLVYVYRDEEASTDVQLAALIGAWLGEPHVTRIVLPRLSAETVPALIAPLSLPLAEAIALGKWLHRETDGNPLFLNLLLQSLRDRGLLEKTANKGDWRLDRQALQTSEAILMLPEALRESVRNRLRRLSKNARALLDIAAVLGRQFDFQTLLMVSDEAQSSVLESLEELLARKLLRETGDGIVYDFSHDKIREVVYHDMSIVRCRLLHQSIAEILETSPAKPVGKLAEHYQQAEIWDKAIVYLGQTADHARRLFAIREALQFYGQALALAQQYPDAVGAGFTAALHEHRGEARVQAGEFEGALADLQAALDNAIDGGADQKIQELHIKLGMTCRRSDNLERALNHLSTALEATRTRADERCEADVLYQLGTTVWSLGDNHLALDYHQQAVAICRRLNLADTIAIQALHGLGEAFFQSGRPQESIALSTQSLELARRLGDKSYEAENLNNIGLVLQGAFGQADYQAQQLSSRKHWILPARPTWNGIGCQSWRYWPPMRVRLAIIKKRWSMSNKGWVWPNRWQPYVTCHSTWEFEEISARS